MVRQYEFNSIFHNDLISNNSQSSLKNKHVSVYSISLTTFTRSRNTMSRYFHILKLNFQVFIHPFSLSLVFRFQYHILKENPSHNNFFLLLSKVCFLNIYFFDQTHKIRSIFILELIDRNFSCKILIYLFQVCMIHLNLKCYTMSVSQFLLSS